MLTGAATTFIMINPYRLSVVVAVLVMTYDLLLLYIVCIFAYIIC